MAEVGEGDRDNLKTARDPQAYSPSLVDRFSHWVDQLPGPSWLYYAGLALALLLVQIVVLSIEGPYPIGTILPIQALAAGLFAYLLALFPFLDNAAATALTTLRPALKTSPEEYSRLRYQLTTLPARPTVLAGLATAIIVFVIEQLWGTLSSYEALASSPISTGVVYFISLIGYWIFGALIYHTIHQLRVIDRIHTTHTRVDLFRMRPLYAFSRLTALTAASLAFAVYAEIAIEPQVLYDPRVVGIVSMVLIMAAATFAWPLLAIHRLLNQEKGRLLDKSSLRLQAALVELDQRVDGGDLEGIADLNMAIASLEIEQNVLSRIPTWPWQPETVRLLITALLLPLGLWVMQVVLQVMLAP